MYSGIVSLWYSIVHKTIEISTLIGKKSYCKADRRYKYKPGKYYSHYRQKTGLSEGTF